MSYVCKKWNYCSECSWHSKMLFLYFLFFIIFLWLSQHCLYVRNIKNKGSKKKLFVCKRNEKSRWRETYSYLLKSITINKMWTFFVLHLKSSSTLPFPPFYFLHIPTHIKLPYEPLPHHCSMHYSMPFCSPLLYTMFFFFSSNQNSIFNPVHKLTHFFW